jgi:CheY-like chemotaxis protein
MDLRALVVCPDQDSAKLLSVVLSELGMTVDHTPSISRGFELVESQRFDAIVFDYRADQSSEEFLARLRQSAKNRSCLLIAVVDGGFNARPVFGLGANFVLYRPLSSERTRLSLRAACGLLRRERRRAPRARLNSTASVAYPGTPEINAVLTDLSDGGTSLQTANPLPSAAKVYFEFSLPGQRERVRLSGEVAWQDSTGRTGIRFLDVPQSSRRLMQSWLQQNAVATPTATPASQSPVTPSQEIPATPSPSAPASMPSGKPALVSNAGNRRTERRLSCKVGAEIYRLGADVPNRVNLSDISEGGCYVEMPSPLSGRSGVEILVRTASTKLRIKGQVIATHPGFGMGVRFMFRDSAEREEVLRLLAVLGPGPSLNEELR